MNIIKKKIKMFILLSSYINPMNSNSYNFLLKPSSWMAPLDQGWHKTNWDVAIDKEKGHVGIGIVVRDWSGKVIAARSITKLGCFEPITGEAIASHYAVYFSMDLGVHNLILEGDAIKLVQVVNSNAPNLSRFGHVVDDIRQVLSSLPKWK